MKKMLIRQGVEDASTLQGDWRNEVCMVETTLTTQSQTIRSWILVLSFFRMLNPAHRLITKVTTVNEMFA